MYSNKNAMVELEAMEQVKEIYDKLAGLPPEKRALAVMMTEAFISGMRAQPGA
jgi:hypothetical protein